MDISSTPTFSSRALGTPAIGARAANAQATNAQAGSGATGKFQAAKTPEQVHKAAADFTSFFISQSFDLMTKDLPVDPITGGGNGEETWRTMLNQEYGKAAAKSGSFGLTEAIAKQIMTLQETAK
ncbi:MAG TPA: rod-binding protein [Stellaceae bacterium]|nr:rod-binding protein [Stellaceae bacterium]